MPTEPLIEDYPDWVLEPLQDSSNHLNIHIFGPYRADYQSILQEIAGYLRENGYSGAKICTEIPDHEVPPDMTEAEFNWWESVFCMRNAQAAIFVFLEPMDSRLNGAPSEGLNSSAFAELTYWVNFFASRKVGTHVVFEGDMEKRGSLISGLINMTETTEMTVEAGEIEAIKEDSLTTAIEWMHNK